MAPKAHNSVVARSAAAKTPTRTLLEALPQVVRRLSAAVLDMSLSRIDPSLPEWLVPNDSLRKPLPSAA